MLVRERTRAIFVGERPLELNIIRVLAGRIHSRRNVCVHVYVCVCVRAFVSNLSIRHAQHNRTNETFTPVVGTWANHRHRRRNHLEPLHA